MRLTLPLPPNVGNSRFAHWGQKVRSKNTYMRDCDARQNCGLIPGPPERPHMKAKIRLHFALHNLSDTDNLYSRAKWPIDWLVTRGYLLDDGPDNLTLVGISQEIDRKDKRLVLDLEPA